MLRDGQLKIEEVPVLEQQWLESLKTKDRQTLETTLKKAEERWENYQERNKRKVLTTHGQALLPVLEEDVELIRAELHQRE